MSSQKKVNVHTFHTQFGVYYLIMSKDTNLKALARSLQFCSLSQLDLNVHIAVVIVLNWNVINTVLMEDGFRPIIETLLIWKKTTITINEPLHSYQRRYHRLPRCHRHQYAISSSPLSFIISTTHYYYRQVCPNSSNLRLGDRQTPSFQDVNSTAFV